MIRIKYCNVKIIEDSCIYDYFKFLPLSMTEEIANFQIKTDRKAKILSRLMLKDSFADTTGNGDLKSWYRDKNNKPFLKDWYPFNISHSANYVVLAYTTHETIGIDIEEIKDFEFLDVMRNFHINEQIYIQSRSNPLEGFYEIWVKKEALMKAIGIGLIINLDDFNCINNTIDYRNQKWYFREILIHPRYKCYICTLTYDDTLNILEFILDNSSLDSRSF